MKKDMKEHELILCDRLKSARASTFPAMSQKDVSKELGVTAGAISMWETGRTSPGPDHLVKLADIYNVSVDWLLGHKTKHQHKEKSEIVIHSVPLIHSSAIANWDFSRPKGRIQTTQEFPDDTCAAVEIDFTSPIPSIIQKGDIAIVLRTNSSTEGVYMVIEENTKVPVLRKGVMEGGRMMFLAEDTRYPMLERSKVGVVGRVLEVVSRSQLV